MAFTGGISQGILNYQKQEKADEEQSVDLAYKRQMMALQSMQLEQQRAAQAAILRNNQIGSLSGPIFPPGADNRGPQPPNPGQPSAPMQMPPPQQQMAPPIPGHPPGIEQGMGMQPPPMMGQRGTPQPPPQPIPPYQTVDGAAQARAPQAPQQSSQMSPPPLQQPDSPESARDRASQAVIAMAKGPDPFDQMVQQVMQAGAAQGQQISYQDASRYVATDPTAQFRLKTMQAQRKEAFDIFKEATTAGEHAFKNVIEEQTLSQTKERDLETKRRDTMTDSREHERIGLERERVGIERKKAEAAAGGGIAAGQDPYSTATKFGVSKAAFDKDVENFRVNGALPTNTRNQKNQPYVNAVKNRAAEVDPDGGTQGGRQAESKANTSALIQNTKDLAAIRPYKEMLDTNVGVAIDLGKKIVRSDSKLANKTINWLKQNAGDNPDTAEYLAQMLFVQTEAGRVLNNPRLVGQLTDSARAEMQHVVDGSMPIESTERVLKRIQKDGDNRVNAMTKEHDKIRSDLDGKIEKRASAQPMPSSKDQLKSGTVYQTSRGPAKWNGSEFEAQ